MCFSPKSEPKNEQRTAGDFPGGSGSPVCSYAGFPGGMGESVAKKGGLLYNKSVFFRRDASRGGGSLAGAPRGGVSLFGGRTAGNGGSMLKEKFTAIAEKPAVQKILGFFDGPVYPAVYAALALITSVFGLELPFFVLTALAVLFVCLFADDVRSLFVPVVMMTMGRSWKHASFAPYRSDFLSRPYVIAVLCVVGAVVGAALLWRLIAWRGEHNFFKDKSAYKWGIAAVSAAFLLNGAFFSGWVLSDLLLWLLYVAAFFGLYIFFFM